MRTFHLPAVPVKFFRAVPELEDNLMRRRPESSISPSSMINPFKVMASPSKRTGSKLSTVKLVGLVAIPNSFITRTGPEVALFGTTAVILVFESRVKFAGTPLKVTEAIEAKLLPVMTIAAPLVSVVGLIAVIVGGD